MKDNTPPMNFIVVVGIASVWSAGYLKARPVYTLNLKRLTQ